MPLFIQTERFRRLTKEIFWIVVGQSMAVIGSLIGVKLITKFLTPDEYGILALGMTLAILINQTIYGPLNNGVTRFFAPSYEKGDLSGYFKAVFKLVSGAIGINLLIFILVVLTLLVFNEARWIFIVSASIAFAIFSGCNSVISGIQNAARQRSIVAMHQGMETWSRFLIAVMLLILIGATSSIAMVGYSIAGLLVFTSQYLFLRKIFPQKVDTNGNYEEWKEKIWKFSWPFGVFGIFTWLQMASDRWALQLFSTTQDVGLYAVLYQLGYYPMSMATGMVGQFLAPIFYQRVGDASDNGRNSAVKNQIWIFTALTLLLTCIIFIFAFFFHTQIFELFVNAKYSIVSHLLPWMLLSGGSFAAGQILSTNLMINLKTKAMMVAKIITALLGISLNFAGAYLYGITGIIIASVSFSMSYFLWMVVLSKSKIQLKR